MKNIYILLITIFIIILGLFSCNKTGSKKPLLRQFADLQLKDFQDHPIWVNCHVIDYDEPWYENTDEETFRPWTKKVPVDPAETMFLVKAIFTLSDGTECLGFITPQNPKDSDGKIDLGLIQPYLFIKDGKVIGFWYGGAKPSSEVISNFYSVLGKNSQEVFPVTFKAAEGLSKGIAVGTIPGFCSISGNNDVLVEK